MRSYIHHSFRLENPLQVIYGLKHNFGHDKSHPHGNQRGFRCHGSVVFIIRPVIHHVVHGCVLNGTVVVDHGVALPVEQRAEHGELYGEKR